MKTNFNTGFRSIDRELTAILESRNEAKIKVTSVKTVKGRMHFEILAAISIPVLVFSVILILNHLGLIREF